MAGPDGITDSEDRGRARKRLDITPRHVASILVPSRRGNPRPERIDGGLHAADAFRRIAEQHPAPDPEAASAWAWPVEVASRLEQRYRALETPLRGRPAVAFQLDPAESQQRFRLITREILRFRELQRVAKQRLRAIDLTRFVRAPRLVEQLPRPACVDGCAAARRTSDKDGQPRRNARAESGRNVRTSRKTERLAP